MANERRSDDQRLIRVEMSVEQLDRSFQDHVEREEAYIKENSRLIREIRDEQARMKGFWGGVVFIVSAIGVAAGIAISYITGTK